MIIKTEPASSGPMTKGEAKALTDRIRQAVDGIGTLVEQAHDRGAWKAMGYSKWEDYVKAEFGFTKQRSYQLLDQGKVSKAIADATGQKSNAFDFSARDVAAVKADLPAVAAEVKARVEDGDDPAKAVAETIAAKRVEKEQAKADKKAKQAENDTFRDKARAALPEKIQRQEQARAEAKKKPAALPAEDRVAELEEHVRVLEAENADLKAKVKKFAEMEIEFQKGGFEEVIRGKDEVIATLKTRVERESTDKVSWKKSSDMWRKRAEGAGWSNDIAIDIETGAVIGA